MGERRKQRSQIGANRDLAAPSTVPDTPRTTASPSKHQGNGTAQDGFQGTRRPQSALSSPRSMDLSVPDANCTSCCAIVGRTKGARVVGLHDQIEKGHQEGP